MAHNSTKRALLMSVLSLVLCFTMLLGTTFAWFTDSVTSGRNVIMAGNLDIELEYYDADSDKFKAVNENVKLFNDNALWEPGYTEVAYLKVSNAGDLALKYQLYATVFNETVGKTKDGADIKLSDFLVFKVLDIDEATVGTYTRETAQAAAGEAMGLKSHKGETRQLTDKGDAHYVALVIYMPEEVENAANHNGTDVPSIELGVRVQATQLGYESDAFDDGYDDNAGIYSSVSTASELEAALALGGKIVVEEDITVENGFTVMNDTVIELNGNTLSATGNRAYLFTVTGDADLTVSGGKLVAVSTNEKENGTGASTGASSNIRFTSTGNLTVKDMVIEGSVRGGHRAIDAYAGNVIVENTTINTSYGAGVVVGSNTTAVLNNCNITITGMYSAPYNSVAFGVWGGGTMTVNSGEYKMINNNTYATGDTHGGWLGIVMSSGGTLNIKGGNYVNVPAAGFNPAYERAIFELENNAPAVSTLNLIGGTFDPQDDMVYGGYGDRYYPIWNGDVEDTDGDGVYTVVPVVGSTAALKNEINDAANGETVYVPAGDFTLSSLGGKTGVTVEGVEGETTFAPVNSFSFGNSNTFKNITFDAGSGKNAVRYGYTNGDVVFDNCVFNGKTYGFHVDQANGGTITFNNCTFVGFNAFGADGEYTFNNCTFIYSGTQGHTNMYGKGTFNNCTFGDQTSVGRGGNYPGTGTVIIDGEDIGYECTFIGSAKALRAFRTEVDKGGINKDYRYVLVDDVDLTGTYWYPVKGNFGGTFDGNGYTIHGMDLSHEYMSSTNNVGFFTSISSTAVIKNVTFNKANVYGTHYVGVILGWEGNESGNRATIDNCKVINSTVVCDTKNGDDGDKAGAICGYAVSIRITNCLVKDTTVKAYRDFGGIIGCTNSVSYAANCLIENNTVDNVSLVIDNDVNYNNYTTDAEHNANAIVGRQNDTSTVQKGNIVK